MTNIENIIKIIHDTGVIDDITKFDPKKSFKENGIDSLDIFTVFLAVEEKLEVKFSEEESIQIKSANDMANFLKSKE